MADLVVVVGVIGFFAICVALVWACDRIIGPDPDQPVAVPGMAESQDATR